ncbi:MAG: DUF4252 domain-containing protein [Bacteroidales bacterium]|nr:DUF4252 domain-containing protein [Bacteroidales bacterium]
MKKLSLAFTLLVFFGALNAQSAADKIFKKYSGKDGYTTVVISSYMFQFLSNIESDDPDYQIFKDATSGIETLRILTQDGPQSENFGKELLDMLPRVEYKELMVVKEDNEEVLFLVKEAGGGKISEFLLIVTGDGEDNALIVITGNINLESISSLSRGLDLPAMENLDNLEDQ